MPRRINPDLGEYKRVIANVLNGKTIHVPEKFIPHIKKRSYVIARDITLREHLQTRLKKLGENPTPEDVWKEMNDVHAKLFVLPGYNQNVRSLIERSLKKMDREDILDIVVKQRKEAAKRVVRPIYSETPEGKLPQYLQDVKQSPPTIIEPALKESLRDRLLTNFPPESQATDVLSKRMLAENIADIIQNNTPNLLVEQELVTIGYAPETARKVQALLMIDQKVE